MGDAAIILLVFSVQITEVQYKQRLYLNIIRWQV